MSTRLPGARYSRIFDRGRSFRGRLLVAWCLTSPDADRQAGVVVSKKCFHDATDRNRAKRLLRESFRLLTKEGVTPEKTEWIFIGRGTMKGRTCAEVMTEMRALVGKSADKSVRANP